MERTFDRCAGADRALPSLAPGRRVRGDGPTGPAAKARSNRRCGFSRAKFLAGCVLPMAAFGKEAGESGLSES